MKKTRNLLISLSCLLLIGGTSLNARELCESFNYTAGETIVGKTATGSGFTGNWACSDDAWTGSATVVAESLTYPGIESSNGALSVVAPGGAVKIDCNYETPLFEAGSTVIISYLFKPTVIGAQFWLQPNGVENLGYGFQWSAPALRRTSSTTSSAALEADSTYLIVAKYVIDFNGIPTMQLWLNPDLSQELDDAEAFETYTHTAAIETHSYLRLWVGNDNEAIIDEIKIEAQLPEGPSPKPTIDAPIADFTINEGQAATTIDLSTVFTAASDVSYGISGASNTSATIDGAILSISPLTIGSDIITITATSAPDSTVSDEFVVTVNERLPFTITEAFDYTAGELLTGQAAPSGFTGVWGASSDTWSGSDSITAESLSYFGMLSSGGALKIDGSDGNNLTLNYDASPFTANKTVWISYLLKPLAAPAGQLWLQALGETSAAKEGLGFGIHWSTSIKAVGDGTNYDALTIGETYLVMSKYVMGANGEVDAHYWVNPDLSAEPQDSEAFISLSKTDVTPTSFLQLWAGPNMQAVIDEVRISSESYKDDVPATAVTPISNITTYVGKDTTFIDLSTVFASSWDADLALEVSGATGCETTIDGTMLSVITNEACMDSITVTATDDFAGVVSSVFAVTVKTPFSGTIVEAFDYDSYSALPGLSTPAGLSGEWSSTNAEWDGSTSVGLSSLTYPGMLSSGKSLSVSTGSKTTQFKASYENDLFTPNTTVWVSFLMKATGTVNADQVWLQAAGELSGTKEQIGFGLQWSTEIKAVGDGEARGPIVEADSVYLLMAKYVVGANDEISAAFWVNPDLSTEPTAATAFTTMDKTLMSPSSYLQFWAGPNGNSVVLDELRISTESYCDVPAAPVVVAPLTNKVMYADQTIEIDLADAFSSEWDFNLDYEVSTTTATSSSISNSTLTVTSLAIGSDIVVITATDDMDQSVTDTFNVTVKNAFTGTMVESFDYTTGESIIGQTAPQGLTGIYASTKEAWDGTATVTAESLTYEGISSKAGALKIGTGTSETQFTASYDGDLFTENTTVWVSFLLQPEDTLTGSGQVWLQPAGELTVTGEQTGFGNQWTAGLKAVGEATSTDALAAGTTYLAMAKYVVGEAGAVSAYYFINPDLATEPQESDAFVTLSKADLSPSSFLKLWAGYGSFNITLDELRISTESYKDEVSAIAKTEAYELSIYPNPSNGEFFVNVSNKAIGSQLSVYTLAGQKVYTTPVSTVSNKINMPSLESGLYFIQIKGNNGQTTQRIVIR